MCQKANPLPGDWCLKVKEDFELIGLNIKVKYIEDMPEDEYKKLIKNKVREAAFCELEGEYTKLVCCYLLLHLNQKIF